MTYRSSKTYGHDVGLSACFRQHRADSHCNLLHGYALAVHLEFEADELDVRNWVVDFGSLKSFKQTLKDTFDHKLLVAEDDPMAWALQHLEKLELAEVIIVPATGCEAFAKLIYQYGEVWLKDYGYAPRVRMHSVTVREHGANAATYTGGQNDGQV
ncbi:MAG: 6-pyruvoyl tetrahydrobiopterin synthase [Spiribacter salinus]|uniref:6-carboxy-5,6,7,8-tetrahydropterin synthase n=1 Tax=Spiribacter salinus TaxID=1335746 RepID=A0A540VPN2_9GAMM|nr:MAG: 6-pyruvoyl tetrahydrobiopterin synthase [Spiribacter salinus]